MSIPISQLIPYPSSPYLGVHKFAPSIFVSISALSVSSSTPLFWISHIREIIYLFFSNLLHSVWESLGPCLCKWHCLIPFYGWVIFHCKKIWNASQICMSSLCRGHANLLCILPILVFVGLVAKSMSNCSYTPLFRQAYWSGLPPTSPGHFPDPGMEPVSPALQVDSSLLSRLGSPNFSAGAAKGTPTLTPGSVTRVDDMDPVGCWWVDDSDSVVSESVTETRSRRQRHTKHLPF